MECPFRKGDILIVKPELREAAIKATYPWSYRGADYRGGQIFTHPVKVAWVRDEASRRGANGQYETYRMDKPLNEWELDNVGIYYTTKAGKWSKQSQYMSLKYLQHFDVQLTKEDVPNIVDDAFADLAADHEV